MEDSNFTLTKIRAETHLYFMQLEADLFLKKQSTCGTYQSTDLEVQNSLYVYIIKSVKMEIQSILL